MKHKVMPLTLLFFLLLVSGLLAQNNALTFDGDDDCVAIGNMTSEISSTFTVEAWIKPASVTVGTGLIQTYGRTILASSSSTYKPIWVTQRGSEIWVYSFDNNDSRIQTSGLGLTANTWYHIAVSVVKNGELRLYVNGALESSGTAGNSNTSWNSVFTIGDLRPGREIAFYGLIDEVRVWNDVRTATEIGDNYDKVVSPSSAGLVGYWKLDESSGSIAYDSTTNGYNGTVQNGTITNENPVWTAGNDTLPVELSSFTAALSAHNNVVLTWVTQSETSVMGFYIYRGTDPNLANAHQISSLIDATNTSEQQVYVYTDDEINQIGTYYYWLVVSDIDSSEEFYGPIQVLYEGNQPGSPGVPLFTELKQVYPNPFNPSANISYVLAEASDVSISVYNNRGQQVRSFDLANVSAGSWNLTWDGKDQNGSGLSSGVYYIRMQAGQDSFFKKAVLMK